MASTTRLVIYDCFARILLEGLVAMLQKHDDVQIVDACSREDDVFRSVKANGVSIVLLVLPAPGDREVAFIKRLRGAYPDLRMLLVCIEFREEVVRRVIGAGAHGLLTRNCGEQELMEAVYTLRSGHDYLSDSISRVLLSGYVESLRSDQPRDNDPLRMLSRREVEVLQQWGDGLSNKEIADTLFISVRTVESHKNHIMQKLNLKTTVDLMKFAIRNGLTTI